MDLLTISVTSFYLQMVAQRQTCLFGPCSLFFRSIFLSHLLVVCVLESEGLTLLTQLFNLYLYSILHMLTYIYFQYF